MSLSAQEWVELDQAVIWHPYTQHQVAPKLFPLYVPKGLISMMLTEWVDSMGSALGGAIYFWPFAMGIMETRWGAMSLSHGSLHAYFKKWLFPAFYVDRTLARSWRGIY